MSLMQDDFLQGECFDVVIADYLLGLLMILLLIFKWNYLCPSTIKDKM